MDNTTILDDIDRKILKILQRDSHLTVKELGGPCSSLALACLRTTKTIRT